jgi:hypothetical protein
MNRRTLLGFAAAVFAAPRELMAGRRWGHWRQPCSNSPCPEAANAAVVAAPATAAPEYPDLQKWRLLKRGMSKQEVVALVGKPILIVGEEEAWLMPEIASVRWDYGVMRFHSDAFPHVLSFEIYMKKGRVEDIGDPFNHDIPEKGWPTVPSLLLPADKSVFSHYPRFLDLRWRPSVGTPPVTYEIEVEFQYYRGNQFKFFPSKKLTSSVPYFAAMFGGKQVGRWRVRALSKDGISEWSDYRTFKFTV